MECFKTFASKYIQDFYGKFKSASNRDDKYLALEAIQNIKFGGSAALLKDLIHGKTNEDDEFRSSAIWAAGWEALMTEGKDYFFPVFTNQKNNHEVRISALAMIFYSKPSTTDLAKIVAILKTETDYEVINMAYSLFEQWATTLSPCGQETKEKAAFYLKLMKQYSQYETSYGFGVSKAFKREYQQSKYGYGGAYQYWVVGSHKSTTPLSLGMGISSNYFQTYRKQNIMVQMRIQGLAKALVRKFKKMDPGTWKTGELQKILFNDMNIREREDEPVRVKLTISLKGVNVFSRAYDDTDARSGGKLAEFMARAKDVLSDKINHQRMLNMGSMLYEQPSEIGLPMAYLSSASASLHLNAKVILKIGSFLPPSLRSGILLFILNYHRSNR